ncbi:tRNA-splicing endonuclease subunit sen54 [Microbotryomycetes sp. JL221]|nr:tRNA-splicing endonuclease subunit sen54 [Microbotryomycetes sp. JL221]
MEDDRPTANVVDVEEAEEEGLPDWSQFAKLASSGKNRDDTSVLIPFIPKRGEKDFEPINLARASASSSLPESSKQATLSQHQQNLLHESRIAYFTALSSGSRYHSSRGHNSFTWRPELDGGKATSDNEAVYGIHFGTIGHFETTRKQLELLPEEVLYLVERGVVELWQEDSDASVPASTRVPMSVQQTWSQVMGRNDMNLERYQLVRHNFSLARDALRELSLMALNLPALLWRWFVPTGLRLAITRTVSRYEDQMFGHLQFVPSGWDKPLPRALSSRPASVLTPFTTSTPSDKPALIDEPYQEFYHVYKPITKFRKTAPPPPDFRLVVVNATTTPMPDLFEFASMFDAVPFPEGEDTLLPPPRVVRQGLPVNAKASQLRRAPDNGKSNNQQDASGFWSQLSWFLPFLRPAAARRQQQRKPSPYPRLKTGRRNILVAVVDNGTISILRFNEAEFAKLPFGGPGRAA